MSDQYTSVFSDQNRIPRFKPYVGHRYTDERGYVSIYVGSEHHLADCRGYAYEHRLVVEAYLGRPLRSDEIVHHRDENKSNNDPRNLELKQSQAEHFLSHRKSERGLRKPFEPNPMIQCACGCGESLLKYDEEGRPRRRIKNHKEMPTQAELLRLIKAGPKTKAQLMQAMSITGNIMSVSLQRLKRKGRIRLEGRTWHACD